MLSREFKTREKILLLVCLLLALAVIYYQVVHKGIRGQIPNYATDDLMLEIETEQARAVQISNMQAVIEANKDVKRGDVKVYNNLANEIRLVGDIVEGRSEAFSVNWSTPVLNGTTVRREADIRLTTRRYKNLKAILDLFTNCEYRCVIRDFQVADNSAALRNVKARLGGKMTTLTMDQSRRGIKDGNKMYVQFHVTFFETIEGAATTEGLIIEESNDSGEPGALESRAHAYG